VFTEITSGYFRNTYQNYAQNYTRYVTGYMIKSFIGGVAWVRDYTDEQLCVLNIQMAITTG